MSIATKSLIDKIQWGASAEEVMPLIAAFTVEQLNEFDDRSGTVLHAAAASNKDMSSVIKALVKTGAVIDATNPRRKFGPTPLQEAVQCGHPQNVRALLELNANRGVKDDLGHDLLYLALPRCDSGSAIPERDSTIFAMLSNGEDLGEFLRSQTYAAKGSAVSISGNVDYLVNEGSRLKRILDDGHGRSNFGRDGK